MPVVVLAVQRPLAAGAGGLKGQAPSGVPSGSGSHWAGAPKPETNLPEAKKFRVCLLSKLVEILRQRKIVKGGAEKRPTRAEKPVPPAPTQTDRQATTCVLVQNGFEETVS